MEKINNKKVKKVRRIFNGKICKNNCRSIWKFLVTIFILGSIFYGLIWVPSQELKISNEQLKISVATFNFNNELAQLSLTKVKNSCQVVAQNSLAEYKQKNDKLTDEQKNKIVDQVFSNCLFAEGLQIQNKKSSEKKSK